MKLILFSFFRTAVTCAIASVNGQWSPYTFPTSILLSFILLSVGIGLVLLGRQLRKVIKLPHPIGVLKAIIIFIWIISLLIFLHIYRMRVLFPGAIQTGPIFPITITSAVCIFIYLAYISRNEGLAATLGNAFVGAAAGPMVFEFPFDWIVIPQLKVPITYLVAFFTPLFVAEFTTFSLLLLSRHVFITRYSVYFLGTMFIIFAAWALVGFSYPSTPIAFVLNAISKILSFATIAALFSIGPKHVFQGIVEKSIE